MLGFVVPPLFICSVVSPVSEDPYRLIQSRPYETYNYHEAFLTVPSGQTIKKVNHYTITGSNEPCSWSEPFNPWWTNIWPLSGVQCPFDATYEVETFVGPRQQWYSHESWSGYESWFRNSDFSVHRRDLEIIFWSFEK